MYLPRKLEDLELIDLLALHTNRLTQMMIYGEPRPGEYDSCRNTIEIIQNEIHFRRDHYVDAVSSNKNFRRSTAA